MILDFYMYYNGRDDGIGDTLSTDEARLFVEKWIDNELPELYIIDTGSACIMAEVEEHHIEVITAFLFDFNLSVCIPGNIRMGYKTYESLEALNKLDVYNIDIVNPTKDNTEEDHDGSNLYVHNSTSFYNCFR